MTSEQTPRWTITRNDSRKTATVEDAAGGVRMGFLEHHILMAWGTAAGPDAVAAATEVWQAGATVADLEAAAPFIAHGAVVAARERGDFVEAQWLTYRHAPLTYVDHTLVEAAYAEPRLRVLMPLHSHFTLWFSRCTHYPHSRGLPAITPDRRGGYRVTSWAGRGPSGTPDIGETDNARDAVALVLAALPHDCGPAIIGTADDLPA